VLQLARKSCAEEKKKYHHAMDKKKKKKKIIIIVSSGGRTEMLEETDADVNIMGAPMFDSDHALQ